MDQLINILTNPWFWIYIIPPFAFIFLLKYIRKLYPKSVQENIIECEIKGKEFHKSDKNNVLTLQAKYLALSILILTISISIVLIIFSFLINGGLDLSSFIRHYILTSFVVALGVYYVNKEKIEKYLLKENYKTIQEYENQACNSEQFVIRHTNKFAWIFILFGISDFILYSFK